MHRAQSRVFPSASSPSARFFQYPLLAGLRLSQIDPDQPLKHSHKADVEFIRIKRHFSYCITRGSSCDWRMLECGSTRLRPNRLDDAAFASVLCHVHGLIGTLQ